MSLVGALCLASGSYLALVGLAWAAGSDLRRYLIPNRACALVGGAYLLAFPALGLWAWLGGVAVGVAVLALGAALFARGWVGGGDVKLAAAAALWAGASRLDDFLLVTSLTGAVLAFAMLTPARRLLPAAPDGEAAGFKQPMPFGVPLALGGAWTLILALDPALRSLAS